MIRTDKLHQWADTQMYAEPTKLMPDGLDYQGRYDTRPQAAEACTEVGAEDDRDPLEGAGAIVTPVVLLAIIAVVAFIARVAQ